MISNKGKICNIDECKGAAHSKGLCKSHYEQKRKSCIKTTGLVCSIASCQNPPTSSNGAGVCDSHKYRKRRYGDVNAPLRRENGTGHISGQGYIHVNSKGGIRKFQHRIVMEEHLGRALLPQETVHHINGDRKDNRIDNLELWSHNQPPGQRVEDKVEWAKNILIMYEPDFIRHIKFREQSRLWFKLGKK